MDRSKGKKFDQKAMDRITDKVFGVPAQAGQRKGETGEG